MVQYSKEFRRRIRETNGSLDYIRNKKFSKGQVLEFSVNWISLEKVKNEEKKIARNEEDLSFFSISWFEYHVPRW